MFGFKSKARRAYEAREKGILNYAVWCYGDLALSFLKFVGAIAAGIWLFRHRAAVKAFLTNAVAAIRDVVGQIKMLGRC